MASQYGQLLQSLQSVHRPHAPESVSSQALSSRHSQLLNSSADSIALRLPRVADARSRWTASARGAADAAANMPREARRDARAGHVQILYTVL